MKNKFLLLWLLVWLPWARPVAAQLAPPPGGYPWRVVEQLAPVPLPPGGLVPYRQGETWGFADTTGRIILQPSLVREPEFFDGPFMLAPLAEIPQFFGFYDGGNMPAVKSEYREFWGLVNARGEILLLDRQQHQVPLLLPDGQVRAASRSQHLGQLMLSFGPVPGQLQPDTVRPLRPPRHGEPRRITIPLGANRIVLLRPRRLQWISRDYNRYHYQTRYKRNYHTYFFRWVRSNRSGALATSAGRRLTGEYYDNIQPFHDRRALVSSHRPHHFRPIRGAVQAPPPARNTHSAGLRYLDPQGRELRLPAAAVAASDFADGTATVWLHQEPKFINTPLHRHDVGGIIDTLGRVLLPLDSFLDGPDQYGLLRLTQAHGSDTTVQFITRHNAPAFAHPALRRAGPFANGRAWVETTDGRQGLIDRHGRWVTSARYDLLGSVSLRYVSTRSYPAHYLPGLPVMRASFPNYEPADTAYMLCRRAGKYGWVARRSGREVIPARYDSVLYYLTDGLACAYRAGQPYLINAQGRELARGEYRGDWYDYPGRPRHLTRPAEGTWSAVDTTGRPRLPWLRGSGCLTPEGRAVVQEPYAPDWHRQPDNQHVFPRLGLVDSLGRFAIPLTALVQYSGRPAAMRLDYIGMQHYSPPQFWLSTELTPAPSGVYRVATPYGITRLLRAADLKPFTPGELANLRLLPNGWHTGRRAADSLSVLISPTGGQWAAPVGTVWSRQLSFVGAGLSNQHDQRLPFQYGVEKVLWGEPRHRLGLYSSPEGERREGYITRGGTQLWSE
ncbi:WG repeat-containing protein [Hymenobacter sp. ASUV-10]|uniref:WG repeat-containing protein n=1 Tax=Hymenobacter aranciens TaxID=3063996 RepID=A0ABT9B5W7_9BACT|nr:WG repeat-containing protein [Hymenobacter sp. ASUV-10]MDO7873542.1 WG repeat-containing protein [Hymenobacter sp. ASUV-10]